MQAVAHHRWFVMKRPSRLGREQLDRRRFEVGFVVGTVAKWLVGGLAAATQNDRPRLLLGRAFEAHGECFLDLDNDGAVLADLDLHRVSPSVLLVSVLLNSPSVESVHEDSRVRSHRYTGALYSIIGPMGTDLWVQTRLTDHTGTLSPNDQVN